MRRYTDFLEDVLLQSLLPYPQNGTPGGPAAQLWGKGAGEACVGVLSCLTIEQGCPQLPKFYELTLRQ